MKKLLLILVVLLILVLPSQAAVDVSVQGEVYAEIASEPEDLLRAGTRIKFYSELTSSSSYTGKIRLMGLNQKRGHLNTFDGSSNLRLDNLIDWAEFRIEGNLFPKGPPAKIAIGNIEIDYSPYIISLKDDALDEYSSYINHRGVHLYDISLGGFESSGFVLWGFEDPLINAIGGKISKQIGLTSVNGFLVDYRYRVQGAEEKILDEFVKKPQLYSKLDWEQTRGLEFKSKFGEMGELRLSIANQTQRKFIRIDNNKVESVMLDTLLREYEWEIPIVDKVYLLIGYKDFPEKFDPYFRDRTPEFDINGYYLGYNPVDRYRDRVGYYSQLKTEQENFMLEIKLSETETHDLLPINFSTAELSLLGNFLSCDIDIFSRLERATHLLNTKNWNTTESSFSRMILSRNLLFGGLPLKTGFEIRSQNDGYIDFKQGTLFLNYQKNDFLVVGTGIRQSLSADAFGGNYFRLKYKAPNGLEFLYHYSTPVVYAGGKQLYDPDYRLIEPGNIAKVSININF